MQILSIPSPSVGVWYLGPLPVRAYALAIITGIIFAYIWSDKRYRAKGGPEDTLADVAIWGVICGILGARLYHVFTTPQPYFGAQGDIWKALRIWEGGLGIWGGVAGGALGIFIALHQRGLRFAPAADAIAPTLLIGQAIGRFGNYFNQELYGRPTNLPWGLEIAPEKISGGYPPGTLFHPTFLYEALWCLLGAFLLVRLEKYFRLNSGMLAAAYGMYYTLGRLWIEMLRIDQAEIVGGLRLNVWTSVVIFLGALSLFLFLRTLRRQNPQINDIYLPNAQPTADAR